MEQWENNVNQSKVKLTRDQSYLCKAMGTKLPFLPFSTEEERKQYAKCILNPAFPSKEDPASVEWCQFVDGVDIFPKLPVHIRNYRDKFERNHRVRQSRENAKAGSEMLAKLNDALTVPPSAQMLKEVPPPRPILDPQPQAMRTSDFVVVGGVAVGNAPTDVPNVKPRGKDRKKRKKQVCKHCEKMGGEYLQVCPGRVSNGTCAFFIHPQEHH